MVAAITSTATTPQKSLVMAYDIVTEPPAAAVDPAPSPAPVAPSVFFSHRLVWVLDENPAVLPQQAASTTMLPLVVPVTATDGAALEPNAVTAVPKPDAPVKEIDPADKVAVADGVTRTVCAPVGGLTSPNSCTKPAFELSECTNPRDVIDTLL